LGTYFALANANQTDEHLFVQFMKDHNRVYADAVETFRRFAIFRENLGNIEKHNNQVPAPSYLQGVGPFTDLTYPEFSQLMGFRPINGSSYMHNDMEGAAPADVDWRQRGAVTPVQDQGQCGSCWAFSAVGALEGAFFNKRSTLQKFSEQQLVDCSGSQGNDGCNGGLMDNAFKWYIKNQGACSEADYPYHARDQTCATSCTSVSASGIGGFTDIPSGNENALVTAVTNYGPVSVAVGANENWQHYKSGIFNDGLCWLTQLNHGVLSVGISDNGGAWIIKNSWGSSWGESGYMRLILGKGMCGVNKAASYPTFSS